jgi:hypothetical protein
VIAICNPLYRGYLGQTQGPNCSAAPKEGLRRKHSPEENRHGAAPTDLGLCVGAWPFTPIRRESSQHRPSVLPRGEPVHSLAPDLWRDRVAALELSVPDVVPGTLELGDDSAAAAVDR